MRPTSRFFPVFLLAALMLLWPLAAAAQVAVYTVTGLGGEAGSCTGSTTTQLWDCTSVRAAAARANANTGIVSHFVQFGSGLRGTVALEDTLALNATGALTLTGADQDGDGTPDIALSGSGVRRVISNTTGVLTISRIAIVEGYNSGNGGGVVNARILRLTDSVIADNLAGSYGGGIYSYGTGAMLVIERSTIANNRADYGGGLYASQDPSVTSTISYSTISDNRATVGGGGIAQGNAGTLTIAQSTLSGNRATAGSGGGIYRNYGDLNLSHVTLANNAARGSGGGLFSYGESGAIAIEASAIADNQGGDCSRTAASAMPAFVSSLVRDGGCGIVAGSSGNLTGDPKLGPLTDNGGTSPSHIPLKGSPLIDAVSCTLVANNATDQRGVARGLDFPQQGGASLCDIGAVEANQIVVTTEADQVAANGQCSLREAIANANADALTHTDCLWAGHGQDVIHFAPNVRRIVLAGTQLQLSDADRTVIDGGGAGVVVDGNLTSRVFDVTGGSASFSRLSIVRGSVLSGTSSAGLGGGIHLYDGRVRVAHSTLSDNQAESGGAIGMENVSELAVSHSTFSGNYTLSYGGAIRNVSAGRLRLSHSTVTENEAFLGAVVLGASDALDGSIIAGNIGQDCARAGTPSVRATLIGDGSCGAAAGVGGNLNGDPYLGPLQANGGPAPTHAPLPRSDVFDAIACRNGADPFTGIGLDGRDAVRPQGAGCDLGAVESAAAGMFRSGFEDIEPVPGEPGTFVLSMAGTNLGAIPDNAPGTPRQVQFQIPALPGYFLVDVEVEIGLAHTYLGDLVATLRNPGGTGERVLFGRVGSIASGGFGYGSVLDGTYAFGDAALPPAGGLWQAAAASGAAPLAPDRFRTTDSGGAGATNPMPPTSLREKFAGMNAPGGTWTLSVSDHASGDTGSVTAAQLRLYLKQQ